MLLVCPAKNLNLVSGICVPNSLHISQWNHLKFVDIVIMI